MVCCTDTEAPKVAHMKCWMELPAARLPLQQDVCESQQAASLSTAAACCAWYAWQQGAQILDDHSHAWQELRLVLHTAARNVNHLLAKTEISTLVLLFRS